MTHQWVCTNQPNYIIIPLSAVKTREGFVWPAGGMWCTWHFLAKGQLSGRQCQREERRVRSQLLVPTLAFFLSFSETVSSCPAVCLSVSESGSLTSGQSPSLFCSCHFPQHSTPPALAHSAVSAHIEQPFAVECSSTDKR